MTLMKKNIQKLHWKRRLCLAGEMGSWSDCPIGQIEDQSIFFSFLKWGERLTSFVHTVALMLQALTPFNFYFISFNSIRLFFVTIPTSRWRFTERFQNFCCFSGATFIAILFFLQSSSSTLRKTSTVNQAESIS